MGIQIVLDNKKECIIWIDANIYNKENQETYKNNRKKLKNFNFIRFSSVKNAMNFINENKYFDFRLVYAIVSGRLAEEFFNEYVKISETKNVVIATTVYCFKKKYHEQKPYFLDKFLNSGGIAFKFEDVVNYILKDEYEWEKIPEQYSGYQPKEENYGNVFTTIDTTKKYELHLPILIGKLINVSLLENEDLSNFQKLLLRRYCNNSNSIKNYLIKPSGNKNMDIPLHLLSKYFLRLYTQENPSFYKDLNKDLTNNKFDEYLPFIFLLYDALNKGYVKSYKEDWLYRIGILSKNEFEDMMNVYDAGKNSKSSKAFFYSKEFLSFSKDKNKPFEFLKNSKDCVSIYFKVQKPEIDDFYVTNIDCESFSAFTKEREALFLPLSCFEITKISEEKIYNGYKYTEVELHYLDKYAQEINFHINQMKDSSKEINTFFEESLKSKYGEDIQNYYDKKNKISIRYSQFINATPDNNYFLSKIGTGFIHKMNKCAIKENNEVIKNIDDEIPNIINEKNKIKEFLKDILKKLDNKQYDQSYSIGICFGNFIANYDSFIKAPSSGKTITLASLALAIGLPAIKLIPKIKDCIKTKLFSLGSHNINVSTMLNGLNILYAVALESYSIFSFYQSHKANVTLKYFGKRMINLSVGVGFSFLGNVLGKLAIHGVTVLFGISVGPLVTIVFGILSGIGCGYLGSYVGNKISEMVFEEKFVLTSKHLYFKYIPIKYRKKHCNPGLQWNKTYLGTNVKSYIIECIINDVEIIMLLMNIPKDVYEIEECLSLNKNFIDDDNCSVSTENSDDESSIKIEQKGKFIGDLVMPYQGIGENCYSINFVIYGINEEKISAKDWLQSKKNEKTIDIVFNLSVY